MPIVLRENRLFPTRSAPRGVEQPATDKCGADDAADRNGRTDPAVGALAAKHPVLPPEVPIRRLELAALLLEFAHFLPKRNDMPALVMTDLEEISVLGLELEQSEVGRLISHGR
jgi:hypothetical protein